MLLTRRLYLGVHSDVVDHVTADKRSLIMAAVHSKNTRPEVRVRKLVHALGYRYRLHATNLPGKPDLVFAGRKKIIFVHGCFWHRHEGCRYASTPKSRKEFWESKFGANIDRDKRTQDELQQMGWSVLTVWQCELKDLHKLTERLNDFLSPQHA
ncbi:very short patch repair endonuclease [Acidipila rosea]|uniref:Very short patch repair endonuclease n=1 Tax=Acidipila rosea TaxID=768535 RepID=A0A4R1KUW4_9BACT|nr:very short patch repair endonuclease [Acidipila rosea]TCK68453.1 T/G mismatch-specific endonuclease [Acidipila rosea]